ncbi:putative myb dna-binding domain protein [Golovinomyces cichoracearum]|uniref:Putative myb dna-binding domain protein n=1 Tax=Golovinomyces cichoracearum TaxID=62708 RepID=A0A420ILV4_9PEZI|nr:putative myb dna-binding domain protein [Golovinomyces cichoracearum]
MFLGMITRSKYSKQILSGIGETDSNGRERETHERSRPESDDKTRTIIIKESNPITDIEKYNNASKLPIDSENEVLGNSGSEASESQKNVFQYGASQISQNYFLQEPAQETLKLVYSENNTKQSQVVQINNLFKEVQNLMYASKNLLHLLALKDASEENLQVTQNDLKAPDSTRLRKTLEDLQVHISKGFSNLEQLNVQNVLKKLISLETAEGFSFQLRSMFDAANTVSLIEKIFKLDGEGSASKNLITYLFTSYPKPFLNKSDLRLMFHDNASNNIFFELGLEIRTQYFLFSLKSKQQTHTIHPNEITETLKKTFYEKRSFEESRDFLEEGMLQSIIHGYQNSSEQVKLIRERVYFINSHFSDGENILKAGTNTQIKNLCEHFSWHGFLKILLRWSQSRVKLYFRSIENGGVHVTNELSKPTTNLETSTKNCPTLLSYSSKLQISPSKKVITLSPEFSHVSSQSLFTKQNIRRLRAIKRTNPKNTPELHENYAISSRKSKLLTQKSKIKNPQMNQVSLNCSKDKTAKSRGEVLDSINNLVVENSIYDSSEINEISFSEFGKIKTRQTFSPKESRSVTSHAELENLSPTQKNVEESSSSHIFPAQVRQSSVESIDQGFEEDKRNPDPERRILLPVSRRFYPAQYNTSSSVQISTHSGIEYRSSAGLYGDDDDADDEAPRPTMTQISSLARQNAAQSRSASSIVQTRIRWSERDEKLLVQGIEKYGCSWSCLSNIIKDFDRYHSQVALKDKARNMKVSFLKSVSIEAQINFFSSNY